MSRPSKSAQKQAQTLIPMNKTAYIGEFNKDAILEKIMNNEYIPPETFEEFVRKKTQLDRGKRMIFPVYSNSQNK